VKRADLCLRPEHFEAEWHDYANFDRFIQAGREVALEHLDEIRALLQPGHLPHVKPNDHLVDGCVA
jgi:NTE family protein